MGRTSKQAFIGTILSGLVAGLMGCTSLPLQLEPTPLVAKPQPKAVRTAPPRNVVKKKVTVKKVVKPVEESQPVEENPVKPPIIPRPGGGGGGGGGGWG